jgi:hypothetical protein
MPDYYTPYVEGLSADVHIYSSYSYTHAIDQLEAVCRAVAGCLGARPGRVGYEPRTLPSGIRDGAVNLASAV